MSPMTWLLPGLPLEISPWGPGWQTLELTEVSLQTGKRVDAGKNILELYTAQNGMLGKGGISDFVGNES